MRKVLVISWEGGRVDGGQWMVGGRWIYKYGRQASFCRDSYFDAGSKLVYQQLGIHDGYFRFFISHGLSV